MLLIFLVGTGGKKIWKKKLNLEGWDKNNLRTETQQNKTKNTNNDDNNNYYNSDKTISSCNEKEREE